MPDGASFLLGDWKATRPVPTASFLFSYFRKDVGGEEEGALSSDTEPESVAGCLSLALAWPCMDRL